MGTDTALKFVGLVLNVFGLPTGLFSIIKDTISLGKDIAREKKLSEKERFIRELTETAISITSNENCNEDVIENIMATLSDSERFSAKKILEHFDDVEGYSAELTISRYGDNYANDPSAEGYKHAMEQLFALVYKKLQILEVVSNSEEAILKKLFSYETLLEENHAILLELKYRDTFAAWLDGQELPAPVEGNIFNYCNPQIGFYGREKEIEDLKQFVKPLGVSVWGIAGLGGSGKSKLAREFAKMEKPNLKTVWLKAELFDELLHDNFNNDFSYPLPVLFICDYAAQYEDKLKNLIEKFCSHPSTRAKFLLLERQSNWYVSFVKNNDRIYDLAIKDKVELKPPIDLTNTELDAEDCKKIIYDLSVSKQDGNPRYSDANLQHDDYDKIINRAQELSENKTSVRCLFMLLLTDAFLRGDDIHEMDSTALMKNYIRHSKDIMPSKYQNIVDEGFRLLAYATACGSIMLNELKSHAVVNDEWKTICTHLGNSNKKIISFFNQLSESDEKNMLAALKPDLIGEFLFLNEWNDIVEGQEEWLSELLKENESRTFIARCLTDWKTESEHLCEMLSDVDADEEQRIQFAKVLNLAVKATRSAETQMEFINKISNMNHDYSIAILLSYTDAIRYNFEHAKKYSIREKCEKLIGEIDFNKYRRINHRALELIFSIDNSARIYQSQGKYDKALKHYETEKVIFEPTFGSDHLYTASCYSKIADILFLKEDYKNALECYEKALLVFEKKPKIEHTHIATIYINIGNVYRELGNYKMAIDYNNKALEIYTKELGYWHPHTAIAYDNIGSVYLYIGEFNNAKKFYEKAIDIREKVLGTEHLDTAISYNSIAVLYYNMNEFDKALNYAHNAERIHEKILGEKHPNTQKIYSSLAQLYYEKNDSEKAKEYAKKAGIIPTPSSQP